MSADTERRLRPIADAISALNYKQALRLTQKLDDPSKAQSSLHMTARVLRAIALHRMGAYNENSKTYVATMSGDDFYGNEQSVTIAKAGSIRIEHEDKKGNTTRSIMVRPSRICCTFFCDSVSVTLVP